MGALNSCSQYRSSSMMTPALLDALEARCRAHVATLAGDAAHDMAHITRVVATARALAAREGARPDVVLPAAWLHDVVAVPKDSPLRAQASRLAAAEAVRLLAEWSCDSAVLPDIAHAIEAHSFSAGIPPSTVEARVVQDADRLDALGAVGLARCLMLGAVMGRPLYDPDDPFCEHRAPDDARSSIDHFYTKLLTLADTMQTAAGRTEAARRTQVLRRFLDDLRRELGGDAARP
jgi:uncharacterized protein